MADDLFAWAEQAKTATSGPPGVPPAIYALFERLALNVIATGRKRYSARAILHRIRWFHQIERGEGDDFKCNNNWTPAMSRWFMAKYPEHSEFFETRERREVNDG